MKIKFIVPLGHGMNIFKLAAQTPFQPKVGSLKGKCLSVIKILEKVERNGSL